MEFGHLALPAYEDDVLRVLTLAAEPADKIEQRQALGGKQEPEEHGVRQEQGTGDGHRLQEEQGSEEQQDVSQHELEGPLDHLLPPGGALEEYEGEHRHRRHVAEHGHGQIDLQIDIARRSRVGGLIEVVAPHQAEGEEDEVAQGNHPL